MIDLVAAPEPERGMDGSGAERYNNEVVRPSEASMAETTRDAEQVMANIRELNEQILEAGPFGGPRVPGRLRAKLRTFADSRTSSPMRRRATG
jgi:hypothetical protein